MISGFSAGTLSVVALGILTCFNTSGGRSRRALVALVVFTGFTTAALASAFDLASGIFGKNGAGFATLHARERNLEIC